MRKTIKIHCHFREDVQKLIVYLNNIEFNNLDVIRIEKSTYDTAKITVRGPREKIVELMKLLMMTQVTCEIK